MERTVNRAIRVGVTGKIGSGKSTLVEMMREAGMIVIDSDTIAKELMQQDEKLRFEIEALLGPQAYTDGTLDRTYIAERIFQNAALRKQLEAIVHPAVRVQMEFVFRNSPAAKPVVVESALLFQTDLWESFDYIILVEAPDEAVRQRLAARFTPEDVDRRLAEQAYVPQFASRADFVLSNAGSAEQFRDRARAIIRLIELLSTSPVPDVPRHSLPDEPEPEDSGTDESDTDEAAGSNNMQVH